MAQRMSRTAMATAVLGLLCGMTAPLLAMPAPSAPAPWQDQAAAPARVLGTVTATGSNTLTVKPDHGDAVTVSVPDNARVLRLEPGQKTLSAATPIQLTDISVGDRVLASGMTAADGSIDAHLVVAMRRSDIAQRQQAEEEAWQKNGVGGIVKSVDAATSTIVLSEAAQNITVKTTPATVIRRYANDSVAYKDAQPATFAGIQPGDQLRARGDQPLAGNEITANAIVFGSFQNIAGLVLAVDPAAQTLTVQDLATRKPVTLTVNSSSELRKLPDQVAEFVAMRLRAMKAREQGGDQDHGSAHMYGHSGAAGQPGMRAGGGFNRVLQHASVIPLSGLHKGDAVMVVATEGSGTHPGTAVTLLAGVEPMLRASAKASQSMFSSSWSLGGGQAAGGSGGDSGDSVPQQR